MGGIPAPSVVNQLYCANVLNGFLVGRLESPSERDTMVLARYALVLMYSPPDMGMTESNHEWTQNEMFS